MSTYKTEDDLLSNRSLSNSTYQSGVLKHSLYPKKSIPIEEHLNFQLFTLIHLYTEPHNYILRRPTKAVSNACVLQP